MDPFLCTHIVYTFAGLSLEGNIVSLDFDNDVRDSKQKFNNFGNAKSSKFSNWMLLGNYHKALELREKNPCLKVLIAIGGEWISLGHKFEFNHHDFRSSRAQRVFKFK